MKIDWDKVSTSLTLDELTSTYAPVGQFILLHTQFDMLIGRILLAQSGLEDNPIADHLIQTIGAVDKKRTLDALASTFGGDPHGLVPDYKPNLALKKRLKDFSAAFEKMSKIRNTVAHGTLAKYDGRVLMGSISAPYFFKATGGVESWVFIDEITDLIVEMVKAMEVGKAIRADFSNARRRMLDDQLSG